MKLNFAKAGPQMLKEALVVNSEMVKDNNCFLIYRKGNEQVGEDPEQLQFMGIVFNRVLLAKTTEDKGYLVFEHNPQ